MRAAGRAAFSSTGFDCAGFGREAGRAQALRRQGAAIGAASAAPGFLPIGLQRLGPASVSRGMPNARIQGASLRGAGAELVTVEARFESGERRHVEVVLSGLPDPVIRESRARLLAALAAERLSLPAGRYYVNLVPAATKKRGELLDLPLALALCCAAGHAPPEALEDCLFLGEVGIDGRLHPVPGGLAAAELVPRAGLKRLIGPAPTAGEAAHLPGARAFAAASLGEALALGLKPDDRGALEPPPRALRPELGAAALDLVRGQPLGKQALLVAAAGGHHLLFLGPPGTGKSTLARALPSLLAPPSLAERIEITRVRSALGAWPAGLAEERPFRAPHHTTSYAGLVGGGSPLMAGEVSLAHRGVLFLDELTEWKREVLEALRQPLEIGHLELARVGDRARLPAAFRLVAAMNPCPCGYLGHPTRSCRCSRLQVARYRGRLSGPLLDRIDLRVELGAPRLADLLASAAPSEDPQASQAEPSPLEVPASDRAPHSPRPRPAAPRRSAKGSVAAAAAPRAQADSGALLLARLRAAQAFARARQGELENAALDAAQLDRFAPVEGPARDLLARAQERRGLSARALQSLRRVARTLADLEGRAELAPADLAQALELRQGLGEGQ